MATNKVTIGASSASLMSGGPGGSSSNGSGSTPSATVTSASSSSTSATSPTISSPNNPVVQEFSVRVPKPDKPMSVMRFNGALNVDIAKWTQLKMLRDDHLSRKAEHVTNFYEQPDMPKFGAGSEFGREAREEARRRKYGQHKKKINLDDQPWVLKAMTTDKQTRRFKGLREGTISENASYFVFTQATDGQFEVFPVSQWYNFTPIQTYKALSAEEAEEEFGRRDKIMNYFNVMVRKRMKGDEGEGADKDEEKASKKKGGGGGGLKVSEMEDWDDVNEMESDEDDEDGDAEKPKKPKKKKAGADKKKKKKGSDSEANEDSDDGDGEGRELDYISDSSMSQSSDDEEGNKKVELGGVDQESGLRNLLESDSSEEENPEEKKKEEETEEAGEKPKKKKGKKGNKKKPTDSSSPVENLSDDSDDDDPDGGGGGGAGGAGGPSVSSGGGGSGGPSTSGQVGNVNNDSDSSSKSSVVEKEKTPDETDDAGNRKRKQAAGNKGGAGPSSGQPSAKKPKLEVSSVLLQTAASEGITEEAVRRYLLRKPMTATELLQKFKSKKTKVASEDMVTVIASILKKINPMKRTQSTKMYLYLKN